MKFKHTFFIALGFLFLSFNIHKYYVSLTDINYNEESKSLQVITNVFMDDIELALNKEYKIDLRLDSKLEMKNADVYFEKYLKNRLEFLIDGKLLSFNYLGKEYEGDLVFFYIEIPEVSEIQSIEIKNRILLKYFEDQQNIVKVKFKGKRRSKILGLKNDKALLKF